MALKNPLNILYKTAVFNNNIGKILLFIKLIKGDFLQDLPFKFTSNFRLFISARSINKVAIKDKKIGFKMLVTVKGFFKNILQQLVLYLNNAFNTL